jgi:hypothetical protein
MSNITPPLVTARTMSSTLYTFFRHRRSTQCVVTITTPAVTVAVPQFGLFPTELSRRRCRQWQQIPFSPDDFPVYDVPINTQQAAVFAAIARMGGCLMITKRRPE